MKIALIGFGKMGQMIKSVAEDREHEVVCIIDPVSSPQTFDSPAFRSANVAIEFSRPDAAEANIRAALAQGVPVVSGTTGWDVEALKEDLSQALPSKEGVKRDVEHPGVIWSSNYSIGVNILFAVNRYLANLLLPIDSYSPSITEIHHIHKLDAPSGTAKTLAEEIESIFPSQKREEGIPIESIREGEIPGIHEVRWESAADILTLRHEAKSRQGFALGAILAAEWLAGKQGWHTMNEVLRLSAQ